MDPATYGLISTLVGVIVGAAASIVTTIITSRNNLKLQKDGDDLQRVERARAFQRNTLLELQENLQASMRNIGEMHHHDVVSFRKSGEWQKSLLGNELNERVLKVNQNLSLLTERIADDDLRNKVKVFRDTSSKILFTSSESEGDTRLSQSINDFNVLMEQIGKVLRDNY
ncbi:MAG: hypothetical protein WEB02_11325 [Methylophaga sp.]